MTDLGKNLIEGMYAALDWARDGAGDVSVVRYYFRDESIIPNDRCFVAYTFKPSVTDCFDGLKTLAKDLGSALAKAGAFTTVGVLNPAENLCFAACAEEQYRDQLLAALQEHPIVRDASFPIFLQETKECYTKPDIVGTQQYTKHMWPKG